MDNTAYIDTFFSFICSELTTKDKNPSFPIFYGSVNGIKEEYNYDISEDYQQYKKENWFYKNLGNLYTLDLYISSDEDDEDDKDDKDEDEEDEDEEDEEDEEWDAKDKKRKRLKVLNKDSIKTLASLANAISTAPV